MSQNVIHELNFEPLEKSIKTLVHASEHVDEQAESALKKLRKVLPKHPHLSLSERLAAKFSSTGGCHGQTADSMQLWDQPSSSVAVPEPQLKGMKEIKKILLAIRAINKKKQGFEGGFITEEGIKVGS